MTLEEDWPPDRTREMFDAWFDVTLGETVVDLVPEDPLTDADLDVEALDRAVSTCAWCGGELTMDTRRAIGFMLRDRRRVAHCAGLRVDLLIDEDRIVTGVVAVHAGGQEARAAGTAPSAGVAG